MPEITTPLPGHFYWIRHKDEGVWRPCYVFQDLHGNLWVAAMGFADSLDERSLLKFEFSQEIIPPQVPSLPSITAQPCSCPSCGWTGTVRDCEPDVDGDGSLGCPKCFTIVKV